MAMAKGEVLRFVMGSDYFSGFYIFCDTVLPK